MHFLKIDGFCEEEDDGVIRGGTGAGEGVGAAHSPEPSGANFMEIYLFIFIFSYFKNHLYRQLCKHL